MSMTDILDPAVIESLRQLTPPGEPDVLNEVLAIFLQEVPPRIERVRNFHATGNIEEILDTDRQTGEHRCRIGSRTGSLATGMAILHRGSAALLEQADQGF